MSEEESSLLDSKIVPATAVLVVILIAAGLFLSIQNTPSGRSTVVGAVNDVKQLVLGCRAYAADNNGNYPPSLSVLYPDYIDHRPLFEGLDERGKNKSPMIYHPGLTNTSNSGTQLIEHPFTFGGKKVIGYANGQVTAAK